MDALKKGILTLCLNISNKQETQANKYPKTSKSD